MSTDVLDRLDQLYRIGPGEGANRPGLSAAEEEAHVLVAGWLARAGADVTRDRVGNTLGRLRGEDDDAAEIWVGSHLDSVPDGGRFDGALGVVAAVAALERLRGRRLNRTIAAVAFRDEEGWRFGHGFFGSRAACGLVQPGDLALRDAAGTTVAEALAELGFADGATDGPDQPAPAVFIEPHIEQGPVLEGAGEPLGIVRTITGMAGMRVTFDGRGGHAGTVPLADRSDALVAAARYVLALRREASGLPDAVVTVGECVIPRAASNVIPERVALSVDARAPLDDTLDRLVDAVEGLAHQAADAEGGSVAVERLYRHGPVALDEDIQAALGRACAAVGTSPPVLVSGAGHDAGILAAAGAGVGMLFVRSGAGGASHSPEEITDPEAIELAVQALVVALSELAGA